MMIPRRLFRPFVLFLVATLGIAACAAPDEAGSPQLRTGTRRAPSATEGDDSAGTARSSPSPGASDGKSRTPSKGCNGGAPRAATSGLSADQSMTVNGAKRTYDLVVPTGYDPARAYPVVFVFHGSGGTGAGAHNQFGFDDIAGDAAIFVYPDGKDRQWDLDSAPDDNGDVAFFDELLGSIEESLCVDSSRVFAAGFSNGAFFANQLGCHRGDKLRALVSHGGGGPYGNDSNYDDDGNLVCAGRPPAVMFLHGQDDGVVEMWHAEAGLSHWKWANQCSGGTKAHAPSPCVELNGCSEQVVWCSLPGVGHEMWWAGASATWAFFSGF